MWALMQVPGFPFPLGYGDEDDAGDGYDEPSDELEFTGGDRLRLMVADLCLDGARPRPPMRTLRLTRPRARRRKCVPLGNVHCPLPRCAERGLPIGPKHNGAVRLAPCQGGPPQLSKYGKFTAEDGTIRLRVVRGGDLCLTVRPAAQRGPQAAEGRGWRQAAAGEPEPLVLERCMVLDPAQQWRWVDTEWGLNPHAALRWALRRRQRRTADAHACAHSSMAPAGQCIGRERLRGSDHHRLRFVPCPSSDGAPEGPRRCDVSRAAATPASPAAHGGCRH